MEAEYDALQDEADEAQSLAEEANDNVADLTNDKAELEADVVTEQGFVSDAEKNKEAADQWLLEAVSNKKTVENDLASVEDAEKHLDDGGFSEETTLEYYNWKGPANGHQLAVNQSFYRGSKNLDVGIDTAYVRSSSGRDHGSVSTKKADDGDWKGGTPDRAFTGWCAILWHTRLAARLAAVVGDAQAQARFSAAADGLAATITARFRHADGSFGDGTQTSYAVAGGLGLMDRAAAGDALARLMRQEGDVLSCGIFGASLAWGILHETGHDDAVEAWLNREASPSYHRMLANGSGSLAEMFEVTVDSYNHAMFSSYAQWLYEALGGIAVADDAVAADHVVISPYLSPATNRVEASLATRSGRVATRWTRGDDGTVELVASIPAGMRADFRAPTGYELVRTSERADDGVVTRSWWLQPQAAPAGSRA